MASFKYTFNSGDTLTPARLNDARDVFDIVNADIKSDAAIAGTKIAPNFGSQNITGAEIISLAGGGEGGQLTLQNAAGNAVGSFIDVESANVLRIYNAQNAAIGFGTNNGERMRITAAGDVGIGTNNPAAKLHISGGVLLGATGGEGGEISFQNGAANAIAAFIDVGTSDNLRVWNTLNTATLFSTNNAERMRITGGGNVGIGTNNPSARLHVAQGVLFLGAGGGEGGQLELENAAGTAVGSVFDVDSSNNLRLLNVLNAACVFATNNSERMRISAAGNVGIGTGSPSSLLHVAGDLTISSATTAASANAGGETLPANPVGFLVVSINGTSRKIPYYAT
jgi:ribosomal protein S8E